MLLGIKTLNNERWELRERVTELSKVMLWLEQYTLDATRRSGVAYSEMSRRRDILRKQLGLTQDIELE
jgi:hypothetical protein